MDLTTFSYITELPVASEITNALWYELAVRAYNLGLTALWLLIAFWLIDKLFVCFSKLYRKGAD